VLALGFGLRPAAAQTENLLDRISNQRMRDFEERLTNNINGALNRYVSHSQYVLSVKVIWNRDIIPVAQTPGISPTKQKLPGFPIFVNAPGAATGDESAPPFVRMLVKVLIDETLPEYYERFIRKIVPVVARFDAARGDQVVVLKETFPVKNKEEDAPPPTIPEQELMRQLGQTPQALPPKPALRPRADPMQAARIAYEEGRYQDALGIVQSGFQSAKTDQERSVYLGMEGSVLYTMKNQEGAIASWKRSLKFDPANLDVQKVMRFFDNRANQ
jgi:tetratricopeptide (TPR) repeat protein